MHLHDALRFSRRAILTAFVAVAPAEALAEENCVRQGAFEVCEVGLPREFADGIYSAQESVVWCWAASMKMIFAAHGYDVEQDAIVTGAFGDAVDLPGDVPRILGMLNIPWTDSSGRAFRSYAVPVELTQWEPIKADLHAGRPLLWVKLGQPIGHAMVLSGARYVRDRLGNELVVDAYLRDPWPGQGRRLVSADDLNGFVIRVDTTPCLVTGRVRSCEHVVHPGGDFSPCTHPQHAGDLGPGGALFPCGHPQHLAGDPKPCEHHTHESDPEVYCPTN